MFLFTKWVRARGWLNGLGSSIGVFYLIPLFKNTKNVPIPSIPTYNVQITIYVVTVNLLFLQLVSNYLLPVFYVKYCRKSLNLSIKIN